MICRKPVEKCFFWFVCLPRRTPLNGGTVVSYIHTSREQGSFVETQKFQWPNDKYNKHDTNTTEHILKLSTRKQLYDTDISQQLQGQISFLPPSMFLFLNCTLKNVSVFHFVWGIEFVENIYMHLLNYCTKLCCTVQVSGACTYLYLLFCCYFLVLLECLSLLELYC